MHQVVSCPWCHREEYYGMMHWHDAHQFCRECIYEIWERESTWRRKAADLTFPLYADGVDYTK
jgi:hypothetical protein